MNLHCCSARLLAMHRVCGMPGGACKAAGGSRRREAAAGGVGWLQRLRGWIVHQKGPEGCCRAHTQVNARAAGACSHGGQAGLPKACRLARPATTPASLSLHRLARGYPRSFCIMAVVLALGSAVVSSVCTLAATRVLAGRQKRRCQAQQVRALGRGVSQRCHRPVPHHSPPTTHSPAGMQEGPHSSEHWVPGVERVGVLGSLITCAAPAGGLAGAVESRWSPTAGAPPLPPTTGGARSRSGHPLRAGAPTTMPSPSATWPSRSSSSESIEPALRCAACAAVPGAAP